MCERHKNLKGEIVKRFKKLAKLLTIALATSLVAAICVAMSACSGSEKTLTGSYSKHSYGAITTGVEWYVVTSYQLDLFSAETYVLSYKIDLFGTDYEGRGFEEVVTTGNYSSVASADGDASHLDVTLEQANSVSYNINGKLATIVKMAFNKTGGSAFVLNSERWNSTMTSNYALMQDEGVTFGSDDEAKNAFMDTYGMGYTITIEEPALEEANTSLNAQIVSIEADEDTTLLFMAQGLLAL